MLQWKPRRLMGSGVAIGAMLVVLLLDALDLYVLARQPLTFVSFLLALLVPISMLLLTVLGYLLYGVLSTRYLIGRDALIISWAGRREIIPLAAIESIVSGEALTERLGSGASRALCWFGYGLGRGRADGAKKVLCYSTGRRGDELLISTSAASYVVSPSNPTGFASALRARQTLGPSQGLELRREERGLAWLPLWRDWKALSLTASGAAANAGLFAYLTARYPSLPGVVPLLSDSGQVRLIGAKEELLALPIIGLSIVVANTAIGFAAHRREPVLTYLLGGAGLLVQIVFWSALVSIVG